LINVLSMGTSAAKVTEHMTITMPERRTGRRCNITSSAAGQLFASIEGKEENNRK
jgi:hypothetical protein